MKYNALNPNLSFFQLYRLLRQHRQLADRRNPMFYANKVARWVIGFVMAFTVLYIMMFGILLALDANASHNVTPLEYIFGVTPIVLAIDFGARFIVQETPSQIIKPYVLLPLPRHACIDCFILTSLLSTGNLIWFALLVPYSLISVVFTFGVLPTLSLMVLYYLLVLANSQWYAICRALIVGNPLWSLLPLVFYFGVYSIWIFGDFSTFFDFYASIGTGLERGNLLPHLVALFALVGLAMVNRRLQYNTVWRELGKQTVTKIKKVSTFSSLNRFGEIGEYIKIEIKSLMRNKNPRKTFNAATLAVLMLSIVICCTDIYDSKMMVNFWCFYNFALYGAVMLVRVMSYEANYIDALLVHKENILKLLKAKYYFFCVLLVLPFVLMLPMVFMGKWHILMLLSYASFTIGFQYFILMQLAVYNKQRIPLNEKFISKAGVENNSVQIVAEMVAFIAPMILISVLETFLSDYVAWLVIMLIGLVFFAFHNLWLRNIYKRMMKRKYENLMAYHG
jgi:hypothetical protein